MLFPRHQRIYRKSLLFSLIFYQIGVCSDIIKQICNASVGILKECLPSGGWFSLGLRPQENHPPSGRHSIRIPTLAWHICIMTWYFITCSAMILDSDWSIGVRSGAIPPIADSIPHGRIQYHHLENKFNLISPL